MGFIALLIDGHYRLVIVVAHVVIIVVVMMIVDGVIVGIRSPENL